MRLSLLICTVLLSGQALGCGHCVQDRIAAVYDHALVKQTAKRHQKILYLAWDGPVTRDAVMHRKLINAVANVSGVINGSVRVSLEPAAIALAYQPSSISREQLEARLLQQLARLQVTLTALPDLIENK